MANATFWEGFEPQSLSDWEQVVSKELKGAPLDKLRHRTSDGLELAPFSTAAELPANSTTYLPGEFPYRRGLRILNNAWSSAALISFSEVKGGNRQALHALNHGADALIFDGPVPNEAAFNLLVADILPQYVALVFRNLPALEVGQWLLHWAKSLGISPFALKAGLAYNPDQLPESTAFRSIADFYRQQLPAVSPFIIRLAPARVQGAGLVEETALALAAGHEVLHALVAAGLQVDEAAPLLQFELGLDTDYFGEMARIRAFRQAWAQVVKPYAPKHSCSSATTLHLTGGSQVLYSLDKHTNLLRLTTMGMSAVIAGVQSLCLPSFDQSLGSQDDFSLELSLQIQLLLKHEAHLDEVVDPAAGSYFLEQLTDQIGSKSWQLFQSIEAAGGWTTWQQSGALDQLLQNGTAQRAQALANRKQVRVGVNQYPNAQDNLADWSPQAVHNDFDALRFAVAQAAHKPRIFLLPVGDVAMRMARLNFSINFLGCAGYELLTNNGFDDLSAAIKAAQAAQADAIVLCSDDASWPEAVQALGKAFGGRTQLILAGAPGEAEADFQAAGFHHFIHLRAPLLATLQALHAQLLPL
ncbi:MAG: methylmalonyl-CoA mutase family protein [Sphingobacteriaceae bacterium]|nr:methylmalonyl-CoA mutase family protein [Sphingobacteriaceae bacterium]